jgi:hypothetical protein
MDMDFELERNDAGADYNVSFGNETLKRQRPRLPEARQKNFFLRKAGNRR